MTTANTKAVANTVKTVSTSKPIEKKETRLRDTDNTVIWTVIGLQDCEWTAKTLELLKEHKEQVKLILLNSEWQRRLVVEFNCRRSPAIFKGPTYFGSYDAIEAYYKCNFFSDQEIM
jgi:glutaredoxin